MKRDLLWVSGVCALTFQASGQSISGGADTLSEPVQGDEFRVLTVDVAFERNEASVDQPAVDSGKVWGHVTSIVLEREFGGVFIEPVRTRGMLSDAASLPLGTDMRQVQSVHGGR